MSASLALVGLLAGAFAGVVVTGAVVDWRARLPLALGWGYVGLGGLSIVLAQVGRLTPATFAAAGLVMLAASVAVGRRSVPHGRPARQEGLVHALVAAAGLAIVCGYGSTPVMDMRLEASDPGIYALTAARLDATGGLDYHDPLVRDLRPEIRDLFFPTSVLSTSRSMGFYLDDRDSGRVVPQFLPLGPVWVTVGRWLVGAEQAARAGVAATWLAALAMFGLAWRTSGLLAGAVSGLLLATNFVATWFARDSSAEPFALALVLVSVAAYVEMRRVDDGRLGWLAGAALGLCWLAKLELLLVALPLACLFLLDVLGGSFRRASTRAYWLGLTAASLLFFLHAWGWARPYVHDVLLVPGTSLTTVTVVAALAAVVAAVMVVIARRHDFARWRRLPDRVGDVAILVVLVLIAVSIVYGFTWRTQSDEWDADNFILLTWMLTPAGFALATAGLTRTLWRRPGDGVDRMAFLLLAVVSLILWNKQIRPHLLWAFRRYLPLVLPGAVWMIGVATGWMVDLLGEARAGSHRTAAGALARVTTVVVLALLLASTAWGFWDRNRFYAQFEDLAGSAAMIGELDRLVPESALVLVEPRTRRGLLRFENVLQHELMRPVLRMQTADLGHDLHREVLLTQWRRGRRTFLLTSGHLVVPPGIGLLPVHDIEFTTGRLADAYREMPATVETMTIRARLYELLPTDTREPLDGRLDVGAWDDRYLDGPTFHEVEYDQDRDYRWTRATGRLLLPDLGAEDELMLLRMAGAYPPLRGTQSVTVLLDGRELATLTIQRGWRDYEVPLEGAVDPAIAVHVLELRAEPPFAAAGVGRVEDLRTLGVAVDLVRWGARPR